jgi:hypothetical protein
MRSNGQYLFFLQTPSYNLQAHVRSIINFGIVYRLVSKSNEFAR